MGVILQISEVFDDYTDKVSQIHSHRRSVRRSAGQRLQHLLQQNEIRAEAGTPDDYIVLAQNMSFLTAKTGARHFYAFKSSTSQDLIDAHLLHTNRIYQWLFVEAYEIFEDFLEKAYACMGFNNHDLWPLKDFGSASLSELPTKNFEWYLEQAHNKKEKPQSIINQFRLKLREVQLLEKENSLKINLRLAITLIEQMRHFIVHLRGRVADRQRLTEEVLKKTGLYNNGKPDPSSSEFISASLHLHKKDQSIWLTDIPAESIGPLQGHYNVFEGLSNYLLIYAHVVRDGVQGGT